MVHLLRKKDLRFPTCKICPCVSAGFPHKRKCTKWRNLWSDGWGRAGNGVARNLMRDNSRGVQSLRQVYLAKCWFHHFAGQNGTLLGCLSWCAHLCSICVLLFALSVGLGESLCDKESCAVFINVDWMWKERTTLSLSRVTCLGWGWCKLGTTATNHAVLCSCSRGGYGLCRSSRKLYFALITDLWSAFGQGIFFFQSENICGYIKAV